MKERSNSVNANCRFPAEWEKQSSLLVCWPHEEGDFGDLLTEVESTFISVAKAVSARQRLIVGCRDFSHRRHITDLLGANKCNFDNVDLVELTYDDIWVRDTAPLSVVEADGLGFRNFRFNGWGEKYPYQRDVQLSLDLFTSRRTRIRRQVHCDLILEGGAIDSDGNGTLIINAHCVLNGNRNAKISRKYFQQRLSQWMGIKNILWLDSIGLSGDDSDGHIDTLARFCPGGCIVYSACDETDDPNFKVLSSLKAQLDEINHDNRYNLVPLPIPTQSSKNVCEILPINYVNFSIINDAVLVPNYQHRTDAIAMSRLQECVPDRTVLGIPSQTIIKQSGSLHCMTMQFPDESLTLEQSNEL